MNVRSGIGIRGIQWEIGIRLKRGKCKEGFRIVTRSSAAIAMRASIAGATGTRRAHGLLYPLLKKRAR